MDNREAIVQAAVKKLRVIREVFFDKAAAIKELERRMTAGQEFYSLVIIPKPMWAQSESQEDIRVLGKEDLEGVIKSAKDLHGKIYPKGFTALLSPITVGILVPSADRVSAGIGDNWYDLLVHGKIPGYGGDRGEGNLLNIEEMSEDERNKLRSSRLIELPEEVWRPLFDK